MGYPYYMWNRLLQILNPFSVIASELSILRQLYELDLASRNPPIIRVTESPGRNDTTVTYMDDPPPKAKSALHRLMEDDLMADEEEGDSVFS